MVALARTTVAEERGGEVGPVAQTKLDGAPARSFEATSDSGRLREVVAQRGDRFYTVSLIASTDSFERHAAELDRVLRSWNWDD